MTFPEPLVLSIYKIYPRPGGKARALDEIAKALTRICEGEIDASPRTAAEAVEFLRDKTMLAAEKLRARKRKWIPHASTWFHQSRYLKIERDVELPARMKECAVILAQYPGMPVLGKICSNPNAFVESLKAINTALDTGSSVDYLMMKTATYAGCVSTWPKEELQYVPSATRWFNEHRFSHDPARWRRGALPPAWQSERDQIKRILQ